MKDTKKTKRQLEEELKKTKEELDVLNWGLEKTDNAIKLLYKELEKKTERLQELDQLKSEFVSTVSHELRTPLSITKEGINLVIDGIPGKINEKQAKILGTARDNVDRLARIINSLLDISKIEAGKIEIKRSLTNMTSLINQIASSFESRTKDKGLKLRVNLPKNEINVYIDADRINQVFTNLIENAVKFTKEGHIEVSVKESEDQVECAVTDTGAGISKGDIPKVFGRFQQFGRTAGAGEKGTGLGLAIAKAIIETHRGKIWVESELHKGTKFIFTLPKYTTETLFREYVNNGIKAATKNNTKMSLIVVSVADFDRLREVLTKEKAETILRGMEVALENSLRRSGDVVAKDTGEIIVLLADCDRENCLSVEGRLEHALSGYLASQKLDKVIKLRFGYATYPDEAKTDEELIKKAKKP